MDEPLVLLPDLKAKTRLNILLNLAGQNFCKSHSDLQVQTSEIIKKISVLI